MNNSLSLHTAYPVYDYEMVIRPPEELRNRIDHIRQRLFHKKLPVSRFQSGRNHIVLAKFSQYAMQEEKLVQRLQRAAMSVPPFRIELENYNTVGSQNLFVQVKQNPLFLKMIRLFKAERQIMKVVNQDPVFTSIPKIILLQKLNVASFEAIWQYFQNKQFHSHFVADSMLLLRRREGERNWQILQRFSFDNQPLAVSQGVLF